MYDTYAEIFSERAELYHHAMQSFPLARKAEFQAMILPLSCQDVGSVCDLPSGGGYLAAHLPPRWRYTAVEPTHAFAAFCRVQDTAELIRCPLDSVPRSDSSFDAAISLAGLHHEPEKLAILREIVRLVRPGGRVIIADVAAGSNEDHFLNGFVDGNSRLGHRGEFLDGKFARLVKRSGLSIQTDELIFTPWQFKTQRDAALFATNLFGVSAPLDRVVDALESIIGFEQSSNGVELSWRLRRLVCTRIPGAAA